MTTPTHPGRPEPALAGDLEALTSLLYVAELPTAGIADAFPAGYCVVRDGEALIGAAGLEVHGRVALLRSVAVARAHRRAGLARRLVDDRLRYARACGVDAVYLLTTTAADWFRSLGFCDTARGEAPATLQRSAEFARICPASATCLAKIIR
jgi:amino-acid N-acetyltransferase